MPRGNLSLDEVPVKKKAQGLPLELSPSLNRSVPTPGTRLGRLKALSTQKKPLPKEGRRGFARKLYQAGEVEV